LIGEGSRTMKSERFKLKIAIMALGLVLAVPPVAHLAGWQLPDIAYPFLLTATGLFLAMLAKVLFHRSKGALENELEAHQRQLLQEASALNHHAMVCLTDTNAKMFHVNEKMLATLGYEASELIGKTAGHVYDGDNVELFEEIRAGLASGRPWSGETRLKHKNGSTVWTLATVIPHLDRQGNLAGSISIRNDITAAKMDVEQKDMHAALHKLWDEVYILDPQTFSYVYMNEASMARLGLSEDEYRCKSVRHGECQIDEQQFRDRIAPLLSGEVDHINYPDVIGKTHYDVRVQKVSTFAGQPKLLVVLRDTSEQAEVERVKAELLSTISHELRTPMTSIKGAMGLLLSNAAGDLPQKARDMLSIAYRNADRLVMIINDILDIEKIAAGQMEFDLQAQPLVDVIEEAIAANEQFANRFDVTVETHDLDAKAVASYDFGRTLQVLTNLLSNAAKFSPPGGTINVQMERKSGRIRVSVQDFGPGIPRESQKRIFERFAQVAKATNSAVASTGLGLHISRAIMEQQQGTIGLDSEEGVGSTFYIEFPAVNHELSAKEKQVGFAG